LRPRLIRCAGAPVRRRKFIVLLGCAVASPSSARSQHKLPTIGLLGSASAAVWSEWIVAFEQRLGELGWTKDRTVAIEYRWGEGRPERFTEFATEFSQRKVDVIVTAGSAVPAVKRVTSTIPIVFAVATDPVAGGLVASLARPGSNVTGISNLQSEVASKRLDLLRETLPNLRRLAILGNAGYREAVLEMTTVETLARKLGLEVIKSEIRRAVDIAPAFDTFKGQADALYVVADGLIVTNQVRIITLALAARLPTSFNQRTYTAAGGLMSYGPNFRNLFQRAADLVDKILRGAKPADLPVEQPTKFDLVINLTTARALGIEIPSRLLFTANEVIE
jgi:putative ABC transport system substrate-binding protein